MLCLTWEQITMGPKAFDDIQRLVYEHFGLAEAIAVRMALDHVTIDQGMIDIYGTLATNWLVNTRGYKRCGHLPFTEYGRTCDTDNQT